MTDLDFPPRLSGPWVKAQLLEILTTDAIFDVQATTLADTLRKRASGFPMPVKTVSRRPCPAGSAHCQPQGRNWTGNRAPGSRRAAHGRPCCPA
jgi:hypothetical protein